MADVTRQLNDYLSKIDLSDSQKDHLRTSRDALAGKIKKSFREKEHKIPVFRQQGSFDMGTIIRPLDGEFDLDYGVYLQDYDDNEDNWPAPTTPRTWIIDAVKEQTKARPENRKACVRVVYAGEYHIDLPIYIETDMVCKLSHLQKGWIQSSPKGITEWFSDQVSQKGEDLRKVVKILKGWADYQASVRGKMPSGLVLTFLAAKHFQSATRLDECVYQTVCNIRKGVKNEVVVYNPVDTKEKVSDRLSDETKKRFQDALLDLEENLERAYASSSVAEGTRLWEREFGDRFPIEEEPDEEEKNDVEILTHRYSNSVKPWGIRV